MNLLYTYLHWIETIEFYFQKVQPFYKMSLTVMSRILKGLREVGGLYDVVFKVSEKKKQKEKRSKY